MTNTMRWVLGMVVGLWLLPFGNVWGSPTTAYQAERVVTGWLKVSGRPLGALLGEQIVNVETFYDGGGQVVYYVVYLAPSGFVIVSADDLIEPIIAFADDGTFDPSLDNPLGALVSQDLAGRVSAVRQLKRVAGMPAGQAAPAPQSNTQSKWDELTSFAEMAEGGLDTMGLSAVADVRVEPLVQSRWSQSTESGMSCYNYYTPPYAPDTPTNYPCGCVATALAQVLRFHEYPTAGIGAHNFIIKVDGTPETAWTRGGDGTGGPYNWHLMMLDPNSTITGAQREAIGALCYDAGLSVNMSYASDGSGTDTLKTRDALTDLFGYHNAVNGYHGDNDLGTALNDMVNPNLDYGYPVIIGITGPSDGHAVVADGYGYDASTLYHHLNMGWAGSDDAWYNLPDIDSSPAFTTVHKCVYNIFVSGSGEIISGRVADPNGEPISAAAVTAQGSGGPNSTVTDSQGIYAFAPVSSGATYTIEVSRTGYTFETPKTVTTGFSGGSTAGNRWAIDFQGISGEYPVIYATPENIVFTAQVGGSNPDAQILSIRNSGLGTLNWVIAYDCNWLEIDTYEGFSTGETDEVTLSADITGLPLGNYSCELTISDPCAYNHPQIVPVNLDVTDVLLVPTVEYPTIQAAIDASVNGCTIMVADGTYTGAGNRDIDFKGLAITVQSENGPNSCIIDCEGSSSDRHRGFYFHSGEGQASILDGFTIVNGYALNDEGGGIYCVGASPTITNCIISGCAAGNIGSGLYNYGGGMTNRDGSTPALTNCIFTGNSAQYGGGIHNQDSLPALINCTFSSNSARYAGAMYNYGGSATVTNCNFIENSAYYAGAIYIRYDSGGTLTDCTFTSNSADGQGGAVFNKGITTLTDCTFTENSGDYRGGAMVDQGQSTLTNCVFIGNSAMSNAGNGGGMSCFSSNSELINCLFAANSADFYGGGVFIDRCTVNLINCTFVKNSVHRNGKAVATDSSPQVQLTNCIFWDGGDEIFELLGSEPSTVTVTYSDVQGSWPGEGNIDADPVFVDEDNDDYRLTWQSPGVDSGTNSPPSPLPEYDLDGEDRVIDGNRDAIAMVDMGAYEFSCSVDPTVYVPADYPTIQAAIDEVCFGEMVIIVADGVYTGPGNRDLDFLGKAITVRSENGPENCIIDCEGTEGQPHRGFSFHNGEDNATVLEGFTITDGYGPDVTVPWGAASAGGAILCTNQSSPTIRNCVMTSNVAGDLGGAIFCQIDSSPVLDHCLIAKNTASHGGGMYCYDGSSPEITNCTLGDNSVVTRGGAIRCLEDSSPTITNSIFWANEVADPCGGAELALRVNCNATVIYSDIAGGATAVLVENGSSLDWGIGNLSVDPCFVDPTGGDYHLQSQAGRWDPNNENWVQDGATSRAIDAGNPGCQLAGEPQDANNVRINMGAYGGTAQASKTPTGWAMLGDMTNDGIIDLEDHAAQAAMWLITADAQPGDLDRNGTVDIIDLCLLIADWLKETTWCEY